MVNHDVFAAVAALLHPMPTEPTPQDAEEAGASYEVWLEGHSEAASHTHEERERTAEALRMAVDAEDGADPLLIALARERQAKEEAEERIRALLAYGREFTEPRPYTLSELAKAAGMSVSGARTAYDGRTVSSVAGQTRLRPRTAPDLPA